MMVSDIRARCSSCGTPAAPQQRFCASCGQRVVASPAAPASLSTPSEDTLVRPAAPTAPARPAAQPPSRPLGPPPGRGREFWIVLALGIVLVVSGGIVGAVLILRGGDDRETPTARFRCWDGGMVAAVAECPLPTGRAGLEHVFLHLDSSCVDREPSEAIGRVVLVECAPVLADGTRVRVEYSEWASVGDGLAHYDEKALLRADNEQLYGWQGAFGAEFTGAYLFREVPLSAAWYAPTQEQAVEVLSSGLVEPQSFATLRGEPLP